MKRLLIYFFYNNRGFVQDYITYFLKSFRPFCSEICFVVNGILTDDSRKKIEQYSDKILIRENVGFDSYAYKHALEYYGYENLKNYDEVILANFTMYGPIFSPQEIFNHIEKVQCDFWGITKFPKSDFEIAGVKVCEHLQSYFTCIKNNILKDDNFKKYWENLKQPNSYEEAIAFHELNFSNYLISLGYKEYAYVNLSNYENEIKKYGYLYPVFRQVAEDRSPFLKRKVFVENKGLFRNKIKHGQIALLKYIKENTKYDVGLILSEIKQSSQYQETIIKTFGRIIYSVFCLFTIWKKIKHYQYMLNSLILFIQFKYIEKF